VTQRLVQQRIIDKGCDAGVTRDSVSLNRSQRKSRCSKDLKNSCDSRSHPLKVMFPEPDDPNPLASKLPVHCPVSRHVSKNFILPKRAVPNGHPKTAFARMPEATINEKGRPQSSEIDVGVSLHILWMQSPTFDSVRPKESGHSALCALVPAAPDSGHDFRSLTP